MDRSKRVFKDDFEPEPREWYVKLTVYEWLKIKNQLQVNLLEVLDDKQALFEQLLSDIELLANVLYLTVEDDAKSRGVSHESFLQGLAGPSVFRALDALVEGMAGLFTDPAMSGRLRELWASAKAMQEATSEKVSVMQNRVLDRAKGLMLADLEKVEITDEALDRILRREMLNEPSSSVPAS